MMMNVSAFWVKKERKEKKRSFVPFVMEKILQLYGKVTRKEAPL
jgi:hypothetical protein